MTPTRLRRLRAAAQLLSGSSARVDGVVGTLLAIQAQDLGSARLALRTRCSGLTAADVDTALDGRRLAVGWLLRGTLHLVRADDFHWLLDLTAPTSSPTNRRRLRQLGVSDRQSDRALTVVETALADSFPLTRAEIADRLAAEGIPTEGQATPHLLMLAVLQGVAVLGPLRDGRLAYTPAKIWLPAARALDRDEAVRRLSKRYLQAHGPASTRDLARWSGLNLEESRAGLRAVAEACGSDDDAQTLFDVRRPGMTDAPVAARLLPPYDPYLLGWRNRRFAVPQSHARLVHPGGGTLRATATHDGLVVGTWTARRTATRLTVVINTFGPHDHDLDEALAAEAADVARFEGRKLRLARDNARSPGQAD
jgi:Winged helix DNA-binding domain